MHEAAKIGTATLMLGDCVEVMKTLPDRSVDLVLTDPPFSSGTRREAAKSLRKGMSNRTVDPQWFGTDTLTTDGFLYLMRLCALEWHRLLKPGGHVLCFIDWRMQSSLADAIESADLRKAGLLVWDKTYFGLGSCFRNQHELILHFTKGVGSPPLRKDTGNVLAYKPATNKLHPAQKPVQLLERLLTTICPENGMVLDPFFGSGSTGEATLSAGRQFIGVERDERYHNLAADRLRQCLPAHARPAHAEIPAVKLIGLFDGMAAD